MKTKKELLKTLVKCYYRGSLKFVLQPEDAEIMTLDWQQTLLDITVNSKTIKKYPLSRRFNQLFFKKLLDFLQSHEIHEDFYIHLCESLSRVTTVEKFCFLHYVIGDSFDDVITIKETKNMVVDGTTGMRTWEAALILADWALINKEKFSNKNILELGSGVGFTGVTIAKHCSPKSIYLTDCQHSLLNIIGENIGVNFPTIEKEENEDETVFRNKDSKIATMILDWNAMELLSPDITPDVIIGSDIVYDPVIVQQLCDVLKTFFDRNKQLDVYIASVIRDQNTFKVFLDCLDSMNFTYKKLTLDESVFIEWDESIERCLLEIKGAPLET